MHTKLKKKLIIIKKTHFLCFECIGAHREDHGFSVFKILKIYFNNNQIKTMNASKTVK